MLGWRREVLSIKIIKKISLTLLCCGLVACGGQLKFSQLKADLEAIKKRPAGRIEPPPKIETFENFVYSASLLRSPFQPPIVAEPVKAPLEGKQVYPDLDRPREALEEFSIESLVMVGTINKEDEIQQALIQDGVGGIQRAQVGNYMGKNHGKIIKITSSQIDLMELITDGLEGWVERPRTIVMPE